MKIEITEYEKRYTFELTAVTQLCGQNIVKKTYILESLRRYFSAYRYPEEQNRWRDNVKIDNKLVGRKFFHLCGWIFLLKALVFFGKGIIIPFGKMICS